MTIGKAFIAFGLLISVCASQVQFSEEEKSLNIENDVTAYLGAQVASLLKLLLQENSLQITKNVEVPRSSFSTNHSSRNYENKVDEYFKNNDLVFKLPIVGTVTVHGRNLDNEELDIDLKFVEKSVEEGRKSKLKKILTPILVLILLKVMTVVPLALGILALQAWTGLGLSLFAFIISAGLAIFQLCRKIATDNIHPQITAHGPWEAPAHSRMARSFDKTNNDVQRIIYSAYLR